jgi:FKBP-type peptidyl-prolyl cis-trans isomerase
VSFLEENMDELNFNNEQIRESYALGVDVAHNIGNLGLPLNKDAFILGIQDVVNGNGLEIKVEEIHAALQGVQKKVQARQEQAVSQMASQNAEQGAAFLAENGKKEGVITTESGLQYRIVRLGEGAKPTAADTVEVHYEGKLLNGQVFDSSIQRGQTITFPLGNVIPGWTEGVQLMPVGSRFEFYIPSHLAYASNGAPPAIGPNATLIFDVELFSIQN